MLLWFGISIPLTFLGAFYGYKKRPIEHPVRTNQIPRQIPDQIFYTKPIPGIIMGGILPFGCIFIQLFFILNSIWSHQVLEGDMLIDLFIILLLDLLYVWIFILGLVDFDYYMLGDDDPALLLPFSS